MKNFIKKHYDYFILCLMVLVFAVIACFGVGNTSAPSTFYQTGELEDSTHYNSLCYEIDYSDKEYMLDSVWINFGSPDYALDYQTNTSAYIEFFTSMSNTRSASFTALDCFVGADAMEDKAGIVKNTVADFEVGQWKLLCKDISGTKSYPFFLLSTKNAVKINEIAFVGVSSNGVKTLLPVKSFGAGEKIAYKGSGSSLDSSSEFGVNLAAVELADKLIDEQDKFDVSKISNNYVYDGGKTVFTEAESYTIESVRNLLSGRNNFADKSAMPLGQYVIGLGTAVFGYTTLGVRIMPMIFGLGIIVLAFFLGKLLFGKSLYALMLSGLTAFGGLLLSLSTLGTVDVMFAFFVLLSFTLTFRFYKKGVSKSHFTKDVLSLLFAGISFAAAFVVKATAVYYLVAILFVFVMGMIKQNKAYKFRLASAKDEKEERALSFDYSRRATVTAVIGFAGFVLCTVIFSVIFSLVGYKTYSGVYQSTNVISYGINLIKDGFSVVNPTSFSTANSYSFWGYAVNYGAQGFGGDKYAFGSIILAFISFFSLVYCLVYYIAEKLDKSREMDVASKNLYLNYAFLAIAVVVGYVLTGLTVNGGTSDYLIPTLFVYGVTVCAFAILDKEDKKQIFSIKSVGFTVSRTLASVLGLAIFISFALAVPALIGISANTGLFSWNLLTHTVIVG